MYEEYFGLREKPFSILPDPELIFWGKNHQLAYSMLEYGILNHAGFTVITGEIGAGKTTLLRHLLRKLSSHINVGLISNTPQGRDELLQWIMMSLEQPFEGTYTSLLHRFHQYLRTNHASGRPTILIIDEAQNLQADALESLRMLSNINVDKAQFLQVILVGQPQLKGLLNLPQLAQFAQRVSSEFHLSPLSNDEVCQYIDYRLQAVGARAPLFSRDACVLVAKASAGIPRSINILCDTALVYAFGNQSSWITRDIIQDVLEHKRTLGVFAES